MKRGVDKPLGALAETDPVRRWVRGGRPCKGFEGPGGLKILKNIVRLWEGLQRTLSGRLLTEFRRENWLRPWGFKMRLPGKENGL